MMEHLDNFVSLSEASQDFAKVAHMVDTNGSVVILENNIPRYRLIEYEQEALTGVSNDELLLTSAKFMEKNQKAYKVLAR